MPETKVTIVIPTFNRSQLLRVCLESVLAQDHPDYHVVVLDNASSDDTGAVVRSFAEPRVTYMRNEINIGLFRNWNRAIEMNSSTYLSILPDDDIILPSFISKSVLSLDKYPKAGFSFALTRYIDINGAPLHLQEDTKNLPESDVIDGLEYLHQIVAGRNWLIYPPSVMIRSSAIATVGPFDVPHSYHSIDFNLYLRMAARFDIAFIREELAQFRIHSAQETQANFASCEGTGQLAVMAERMDAIAYLLQSVRAGDPLYRRWLAERLLHTSLRRSEFTSQLVPHLNLSWAERLEIARQELAVLIPAGESFILVDQNMWGSEVLPGRRALPFLERDGLYWGPPPDDETAIRELERMRRSGASFIVFGWPAFWLLDYYSELRDYLSSKFRCVVENTRLVLFELEP